MKNLFVKILVVVLATVVFGSVDSYAQQRKRTSTRTAVRKTATPARKKTATPAAFKPVAGYWYYMDYKLDGEEETISFNCEFKTATEFVATHVSEGVVYTGTLKGNKLTLIIKDCPQELVGDGNYPALMEGTMKGKKATVDCYTFAKLPYESAVVTFTELGC